MKAGILRNLGVDTFVLLVLFIVTLAVMGGILGGRFVNLYNFQSLMFSAPELGLIALAMMLDQG